MRAKHKLDARNLFYEFVLLVAALCSSFINGVALHSILVVLCAEPKHGGSSGRFTTTERTHDLFRVRLIFHPHRFVSRV